MDPHVSIQSHDCGCHHKQFGHKALISGKVHPHHRAVQVYVFSNDGKWYKQVSATVVGSHWEANVCLGFPADSPAERHYTVVAMTGKHVEPNTLTDLPTDVVQSKPLHVSRQPVA